MLSLVMSCEKNCSQCSNICYDCVGVGYLLCNTDFFTKEEFEKTIAFMNANNAKCTKVNPNISFEECEDSKIEIFESLDYICREK